MPKKFCSRCAKPQPTEAQLEAWIDQIMSEVDPESL